MALEKQKKTSIHTININNPKPGKLLMAGFPDLEDPNNHFNKVNDTPGGKISTKSQIFLDMQRGGRHIEFNGENYAKYLEETKNKAPNKSEEEILQDFLHETLGATSPFMNFNLSYFHQGGLQSNLTSFLRQNGCYMLNPTLTKAQIETTEDTQITTIVMDVDSIIPNLNNTNLNNTESIIVSDNEMPLMTVSCNIETDINGKMTTKSLNIEFFDERALKAYSSIDKNPDKDRYLIERIVKKELYLLDEETIRKVINNPTTKYPAFVDKKSQINYLKGLFAELKNIAQENPTCKKNIDQVIKQIENLCQTKQLKTFNTAHFYSALLENNIKPRLKLFETKRYNRLYNRPGDVGAKVIAVLNSYCNQNNIKNFFNPFQHNTKEINALVRKIQQYKPQHQNEPEKGLETSKYIKKAIIDTIEQLGNSKNFKTTGETAKIASFLVNQLTCEINQLEKEATAAPTTPQNKI